MILPTLRQLTYFLALAEHSSFRIASENCHITQSTLSNSLNELESILGEKLFERHTRKVILTPVGKELIPLAQSIVEQSKDFVRVAQRHRTPLSSQLSLGIIPTIAPYILPRLLPHLQADYPQLDLQLKEDMTARQLDALKQGTVDVILMALPYDTPQMEQMILWKEPFFLARQANPHIPREDQADIQVTLNDLKTETILLLDDGHCLRDHVMAACHVSASSAHQKTLGATSLQTLIQMVQNGYGATLLPRMAIDPYTIPKNVVIQRFKNPQPTRTIGLVWRKDDPRDAEFRLLGDYTKGLFK